MLVENPSHDAAVPVHAPGEQPAAEAHCDADSDPQATGVPAHASAAVDPDFPALLPPHPTAVTATANAYRIRFIARRYLSEGKTFTAGP